MKPTLTPLQESGRRRMDGRWREAEEEEEEEKEEEEAAGFPVRRKTFYTYTF